MRRTRTRLVQQVGVAKQRKRCLYADRGLAQKMVVRGIEYCVVKASVQRHQLTRGRQRFRFLPVIPESQLRR